MLANSVGEMGLRLARFAHKEGGVMAALNSLAASTKAGGARDDGPGNLAIKPLTRLLSTIIRNEIRLSGFSFRRIEMRPSFAVQMPISILQPWSPAIVDNQQRNCINPDYSPGCQRNVWNAGGRREGDFRRTKHRKKMFW